MAKLTATFVQRVRPTDRLKRYGDGNGLYLVVRPGVHGSKAWVQRLTIHGVSRDLGLGSAALVSLEEARQVAATNRRIARAGGDPRLTRDRRSPTFQEAAETVIALHRPTWKSTSTSEYQWRFSLQRYVYPRLAAKPVHAIDSTDVMTVLAPIWTSKYQTARRVRGRIRAIMNWAIAQGYRTDNPAGRAVAAALPKVRTRRRHHRALPYQQLPAALPRLRACTGYRAATLALEFLILCAARSGEVLLARWSEVDFDQASWTVPAHRTKTGREHRVPLSDRAVAVLDEAAELRDGARVFPSVKPGRPLSASTLVNWLARLRIDATPHGFRSSFRDWAAERTDAPHAVMEAALAHAVRPAEAPYARSDLFERRRHLMQQWADFLAAPESPAPT